MPRENAIRSAAVQGTAADSPAASRCASRTARFAQPREGDRLAAREHGPPERERRRAQRVPPAAGVDARDDAPQLVSADARQERPARGLLEHRHVEVGVERPQQAVAARARRASGPMQSSSSAISIRSQSSSPGWRTTCSCHSDSCESGTSPARRVIGTGAGRPSRRATAAAAASTADESRPPEKETKQRPASSAGRTAASSAGDGDVAGGGAAAA